MRPSQPVPVVKSLDAGLPLTATARSLAGGAGAATGKGSVWAAAGPAPPASRTPAPSAAAANALRTQRKDRPCPIKKPLNAIRSIPQTPQKPR